MQQLLPKFDKGLNATLLNDDYSKQADPKQDNCFLCPGISINNVNNGVEGFSAVKG